MLMIIFMLCLCYANIHVCIYTYICSILISIHDMCMLFKFVFGVSKCGFDFYDVLAGTLSMPSLTTVIEDRMASTRPGGRKPGKRWIESVSDIEADET